MLQLAWLIPAFPLLGFLLNGLGYKRLSGAAAGWLGTLLVGLSFLLSAGIFLQVQQQAPLQLHLFDWISVGTFQVPMGFYLDQVSAIMLLVITGVGTLIHLYSVGYMHDDAGVGKYFAYLNLFVFFMLLLVMGEGYLVMFIGWEGVGLCSYLLIGFWYKHEAYNNAARKAFIMNRIGDLGFLMGMFLLYDTFGSLSYEEVFQKAAAMSPGDWRLTAITLCLFVGAMGKSAQLPLYTWLPDAMAGPTPVSALIHAATMVTAGIYMVVRSHALYELAPFSMHVVALVGAATALWAALIALTQTDIKKVLAYSTVSQLGYMFLGLGVGAFTGAFFHVLTHAFFKALLFLGAGSVIHAMGGEQDMRKMGGLRKAMPITFLTMTVATLAIAGIPPFAGFFSKDEILAHAYAHSPLLWGLGVMGAFLTSFYMFRLLMLTFFGGFRGTEEQHHHLHESPWVMTLPLGVLGVLSAVAGFMNVPAVLGGGHWLATFLQPLLGAEHLSLSHSTEYALMGTSVAVASAAIALAVVRYRNHVPVADDAPRSLPARLSYNKFYVDEVYDALVVRPLGVLADLLGSIVELQLVDGLVRLLSRLPLAVGTLLRRLQNGSIETYAFLMASGIILVLVFNFLIV